MNNEFDRLWMEVADGSATQEQKLLFNQRLRDDSQLRHQVTQRLLDDATLIEEFRTSGVIDTLETSLTFPQPASSHSLSSTSRKVVVPFVVVFVFAALAWWNFRGPLPDNQQAVPQPKPHTQAQDDDDLPAPSQPTVKWPSIVGTVAQSKSAKWVPALRDKQHVVARRYKLTAGIARIVLVNGVELIADASVSPVEFQIDENLQQATLYLGMFVASVHSEQIGFVIHTPTTKVVDVGTEFAVAVNNLGHSQVDVLAGAVSCSPNNGETQPNQSIFVSSSATRFTDDKDSVGQLVAGGANAIRRMQQSIRDNQSAKDSLMAYESFSQSDSNNMSSTGWDGPWCFGRSGKSPARLIVSEGPFSGIPPWLERESEAYLVQPIFSIKNRKLSEPLDLAVDQDYFFSLLIRRRIIDRSGDVKVGIGVGLRAATGRSEDGVGFSLGGNNRFTVWTGDDRYNGGLKVDPDAYHFVVAKLAARKTEPDNMFVRIYGTGDAAEVLEPKRWDAIGKPTHSDLTVDAFALWTEQSAVAFFDELRVGKTWRSVVPVR